MSRSPEVGAERLETRRATVCSCNLRGRRKPGKVRGGGWGRQTDLRGCPIESIFTNELARAGGKPLSSNSRDEGFRLMFVVPLGRFGSKVRGGGWLQSERGLTSSDCYA